MTWTVDHRSIVVSEFILKTIYVGTVASASLVSSTATVPLENLVAMLLISVPQPVLANCAFLIVTVLLTSRVVTLRGNVP